VIADIYLLLLPLWILLGVVVVMVALALLGRVQNGRYLRPIVNLVIKVPLFKRWLTKASEAQMERQNPELASAMKKIQRTGAHRDPQRMQAAMSNLTPQERRAVLDMQEQQGALPPDSTNREMRRRMDKAKRDAQRKAR
jgi:hypothetical protein